MAKVDTYQYHSELEGLPGPPFAHPPYEKSGVVKRKAKQKPNLPYGLDAFVQLWHDAVAEWHAMDPATRNWWLGYSQADEMEPFVFFVRAYLVHHVNGWEWPPDFSEWGRGYVLRLRKWERVGSSPPGFYVREPILGGEEIEAWVSFGGHLSEEWLPGQTRVSLHLVEMKGGYGMTWHSDWSSYDTSWPWQELHCGPVDADPDRDGVVAWFFCGYADMSEIWIDELHLLVSGVEAHENPHFNLPWQYFAHANNLTPYNLRRVDQIYASPEIWDWGL